MLDPETKMYIEKLREYREQLSEVDTCFAPDIAAEVQANLRRYIENLEAALHAKVEFLDQIIRVGEHRMTFNSRMDREDILRTLGLFEEPEPRDMPKLDALMREPQWLFTESDPIKFATQAQGDFRPSLEELLLVGHDKALAEWVKGLSATEHNIMRLMLPRLLAMFGDTPLPYEGPGDQIQRRQFIDGGPRLNAKAREIPGELG